MNKNKDNKYNKLVESAIQNMNNSIHDKAIFWWFKGLLSNVLITPSKNSSLFGFQALIKLGLEVFNNGIALISIVIYFSLNAVDFSFVTGENT